MSTENVLKALNFNIKKGTDIKNPVIKCILFGDPGSGKTTLASTFPKPLILDFDGGCLSLKGKDIEILDIRENKLDYKKTKQLYQVLKKENPYKTIVIDTGTELKKMIERYYLQELDMVVEKKTWDEWGEISSMTDDLIRLFLELNCNVIVNAHTLKTRRIIFDEKTGKEKEIESLIPNLGSEKLSDTFLRLFDYIFYLTQQNGKRILVFEQNDYFYTKCRETKYPRRLENENIDYKVLKNYFIEDIKAPVEKAPVEKAIEIDKDEAEKAPVEKAPVEKAIEIDKDEAEKEKIGTEIKQFMNKKKITPEKAAAAFKSLTGKEKFHEATLDELITFKNFMFKEF